MQVSSIEYRVSSIEYRVSSIEYNSGIERYQKNHGIDPALIMTWVDLVWKFSAQVTYWSVIYIYAHRIVRDLIQAVVRSVQYFAAVYLFMQVSMEGRADYFKQL